MVIRERLEPGLPGRSDSSPPDLARSRRQSRGVFALVLTGMASCAPAPPEPLNLTEADIARCQAEASRPVVMVGPLGTAIRELPPDSAHEACLRAASARNNAEARFANPPQKPSGYTPLGPPPLRR